MFPIIFVAIVDVVLAFIIIFNVIDTKKIIIYYLSHTLSHFGNFLKDL